MRFGLFDGATQKKSCNKKMAKQSIVGFPRMLHCFPLAFFSSFMQFFLLCIVVFCVLLCVFVDFNCDRFLSIQKYKRFLNISGNCINTDYGQMEPQ